MISDLEIEEALREPAREKDDPKSQERNNGRPYPDD
jgi:hypothetical protein